MSSSKTDGMVLRIAGAALIAAISSELAPSSFEYLAVPDT